MMSVENVVLVMAALFLGVQAVIACVNAVSFPRLGTARRDGSALDARQRGGSRPTVSLLLPVRNEESTLPDTLPRLLDQGADEVVVLDDHSTDRTSEILASLGASHDRLRILRGDDLPDGWTGKNWACRQLADAARGDLWIFTDADVEWGEGALDALLMAWDPSRDGFASVWPRQRTVGWLERIAVPQIDLILLGSLPWPLVPRLPLASLTAGNGQVMAWRPDAYRAAGGHDAVRDVVLEDVRMAQRAKAAGVRAFLALGVDRIATRMYRTPSEVIDGFAKNVLPAAGSWPLLLGLWAANLLVYTLAWPLAFLDVRWLGIGVAGVALRGLVARTVGRSWSEALWQPLAPLALTAIVARVASRRGGYAWRGRSYPRGGA